MNDFLAAIQPALIALALAIVGGCTLVATVYFRNLANKLNEGKDREALHSALDTGVKFALEKFKGRLPDDAKIIDQAVAHAQTSVPDAIKGLQPSTGVLTKIAASKLAEAKAAPVADVLATVASVAGAAQGRR